jgi:riboflavin biosynthesis pyrimidine reductase
LTLTRLYPNREVFEKISIEEQSWIIARDYGICAGWRLNFAIDALGASFGHSGKSEDVSSELDRLLLGKLRSQSDVIVTSGKTARIEKYRSSKHAPIAIFTTSGDLDSVPAIQGTQFFTPLVLTPTSQVERVENLLSDVDVRVLPLRQLDDAAAWPTAIGNEIRGAGFQSPILESGLSTLKSFIASGVIHEICLSVNHQNGVALSARDLSHTNLSSLFGTDIDFKLANLFTDGHSTFSRWVRNGVAEAKATA